MSRYRDWGSGFYEDAFANPPENPLAGLEEVNSSSGLGQNDTIQPDALMASCKTIVKLSQEGSTYYSSIRGRSSAHSDNQCSETSMPVRDKVANWVDQGAMFTEEEPCSSGLRRPRLQNPKLAPAPTDMANLISQLRAYPVDEDQVKVLMNNVPPSTTRDMLRDMLDNSFDHVKSIDLHDGQMIAVTSRAGCEQFMSVYDGAVLDNMSPTPLTIYVID